MFLGVFVGHRMKCYVVSRKLLNAIENTLKKHYLWCVSVRWNDRVYVLIVRFVRVRLRRWGLLKYINLLLLTFTLQAVMKVFS
jgi:hypothetical protein